MSTLTDAQLDSHIEAVTTLRPRVEHRVAATLAGVGLRTPDHTAILMGVEAMIRRADDGDLAATTRRVLSTRAIERACAAALVVPADGPWWAVRNARFAAAAHTVIPTEETA